MAGTNIDPEQPVAWRVVPQDVQVRSSDGIPVGTVADLLGSDAEDIFHGLVVKLEDHGREVFIPAEDTALLTGSHVDLSLTAEEVLTLPASETEKTYRLGWKGIFRKKMDWVEEKDR
jgi:hypothetical protein